MIEGLRSYVSESETEDQQIDKFISSGDVVVLCDSIENFSKLFGVSSIDIIESNR